MGAAADTWRATSGKSGLASGIPAGCCETRRRGNEGTMATVLIVDDDTRVVDALRARLSDVGHTVSTAHDAHSAITKARARLPDLVVVHLGLAPETGPTLSQLLACATPLRVVALADDRRQLERLGDGLESSDYVMRPYSVRELVARVRAALRHVGGTDDQVLRLGDLVIDRRHETLAVRGEPVALTATEFALLAHLGSHAGQVLTREQLLAALRRPIDDTRYERAIDAHVKNIRRKIEPDPRRPRYLLTAHGAGYELVED